MEISGMEIPGRIMEFRVPDVEIVQSAGRFEKCEYKKSVKSRNLLFRQLCQVRIS